MNPLEILGLSTTALPGFRVPRLKHKLAMPKGNVYVTQVGLSHEARESMAKYMDSSYAQLVSPDWYNGYAHIEKPLFENKFKTDLPLLEVHGGITYANYATTSGFVYGFDCNHAFDASNPRWKNSWNVLAEALMLYFQLEKLEDTIKGDILPIYQYNDFLAECRQKVKEIVKDAQHDE